MALKFKVDDKVTLIKSLTSGENSIDSLIGYEGVVIRTNSFLNMYTVKLPQIENPISFFEDELELSKIATPPKTLLDKLLNMVVFNKNT